MSVSKMFAGLMVLMVALVALNRQIGSLQSAPGTSFLPEGAALCGLFFGLCALQIRRLSAGLDASAAKQVWGITILLMVMINPLACVVIAPAVNGMAGTSIVRSERLVLDHITPASPPARTPARTFHYNAHLSPKAGGTLPAGQYLLGSGWQHWLPDGPMPGAGQEVEVAWRVGLLGKTTIISAVPVSRH